MNGVCGWQDVSQAQDPGGSISARGCVSPDPSEQGRTGENTRQKPGNENRGRFRHGRSTSLRAQIISLARWQPE
jgi:hypothetical protein